MTQMYQSSNAQMVEVIRDEMLGWAWVRFAAQDLFQCSHQFL